MINQDEDDTRVVIDLISDSDSESPSRNRGAVGSFVGGAIRLTQSNAALHDTKKISLAEIIQNRSGLRGSFIMKKALLTSYVMDMDWLLKELDGVERVILCCDDRKHDTKTKVTTTNLSNNCSITKVIPPFPEEHRNGGMRCKLMLLHYYEEAPSNREFLRFVISTADLVPHDYEKVQNVTPSSPLYYRRSQTIDTIL